MAYVPNSIVSEIYSTNAHISPMLPELKGIQKFNSNSIRSSPQRDKSKLFRMRNSSVLDKPANSLFNEVEYRRKCKNLWTQFDNRITPILKKYKIASSPKKKIGTDEENWDKHLGYKRENRAEKINKIKHCSDNMAMDSEVQCEISSESSENDVKVSMSRYVHYINIGEFFLN